MQVDWSSELGLLARAGRVCSARGLVRRLEALLKRLQDQNEGDDGFLDELSRQRHKEATCRALLQQLKELLELDEGGVLQRLLKAPRVSRQVHWMHLQLDSVLEAEDWQEAWMEGCREQIQALTGFLDSGTMQKELEAMDASARTELLALQYELHKLDKGSGADTFLPEERELLERAALEISTVQGVEVETPTWFVPSYEVLRNGVSDESVEGEWNGVQVSLEYVEGLDGEARCSKLAEKWCGVASPYLVTLHGAYHCGHHPFLIFDSLRGMVSLQEYTKGARGEQRLWKRLLDVARGLQQLHALGIAHGDVCAANIFVDSHGKAKLKPSVQQPRNGAVAEEEGGDASPLLASDVYAFGKTILDALQSQAAIEMSTEEGNQRPAGVSDSVWTLIKNMLAPLSSERPGIDVVVRSLLAIVERERPWSDLRFPELLLHASDVWSSFRDASQRQESGAVMCGRVLARLEQVLARLWDEGLVVADGDAGEFTWQTRTEHLLRSMRFLTTQYLPSGGQRGLVKIALARRFIDEILQIHHQLDALLAEFESGNAIPENGYNSDDGQDLNDWELQWRYDSAALLASFHEALEKLEDGDDHVDSSVAIEAMTLLKHELDNFRYAFSNAQLALAVRTFDVCVRRTGVITLSAPDEWFIPAYEVRGESWWEGVRVSVHNASDLQVFPGNFGFSEAVLRRAATWSQLVHPHVVKLFGACHVGPNPFFVCERARGGSIKEYLSLRQTTAADHTRLWGLLYEAALGLQYLHEREIVHTSLSCENILVVMDYPSSRRHSRRGAYGKKNQSMMKEVAKLNGLHLIPLQEATKHDTSVEEDTNEWAWLSPERREGCPPSFASDVYNFGLCIVQALTNFTQTSTKSVGEDLFLHEQPVEVDSDAWDLAKQMCASQPEVRPGISSVVRTLRELVEKAAQKQSSKMRSGSIEETQTSGSPDGNADQISGDTLVDFTKTVDFLLPGGDDTISGVLELLKTEIFKSSDSGEEAMQEDFDKKILSRLEDVYRRLTEVEANGKDDVEYLNAAIADFASMLTQFRAHVCVAQGGSRMTHIAATRQRAWNKFSFHKELDELIDTLRIRQPLFSTFSGIENTDVHDWKRQWYANRAMQTQTFECALDQTVSGIQLLEELTDVNQREETLAFLRFEMTRHRSSYTPRQIDAIGSTCVDISRRLSDGTAVALGSGPTEFPLHLWRPPKWFIPPYEVDFDSGESFNRGAFASVHMGKWLGTSVVIKSLTPLQPNALKKEAAEASPSAVFYRELSIWYRLNHPYVVKLYGGCHVGDRPFFVCELASNGRLDVYLKRFESGAHSDSSRNASTSTFSYSLSTSASSTTSSESAVIYRRCEAWRKLRQAALGLLYLHQHSIVHGDLKCDNILVAADGTAKLTDFGLSTIRRYVDSDKESPSASPVVGALRWKAPECLSGAPPSFESDIYSFGMCVLQAVSGDFPWGPSMPDVAVRFHVRRGVLPPRPKGFENDAHWDLVRQMCCFDPQQRLKLPVVVQRLTRFADVEARGRGAAGHMPELLFGGSATS